MREPSPVDARALSALHDEHSATLTAAIFAALGHQVRVRMVSALLLHGPMGTAQLADSLHLSLSRARHHLEPLQRVGLVTVRDRLLVLDESVLARVSQLAS